MVRETWEQLGNRSQPWLLRVCDKAGVALEQISDPSSASMVLRHGATDTGSVTLPADHPRVPMLMADGARYVLQSTYTGTRLSSGTIRGDQGNGKPVPSTDGLTKVDGSATWNLVDDHALLSDVNAAPPAGETHDRLTGSAETVAKTLIGTALTRVGIPHSIQADEGRGGTIKVAARWQPLSDVLYPVVTNAGIGIRVRWVTEDAEFHVSTYEPVEWPVTLTPESGAVDDWSWSRTYPTATRVVVLGPGEGDARVKVEVPDAALETALGTVREVVVDARDVADIDAGAGRTLTDVENDLQARGDQALAEAARTVGVELALAKTVELAYGSPTSFEIGDVLKVELVPDRSNLRLPVEEVALSYTPDKGFTVDPRVGRLEKSTSRYLARRVHHLAVETRKLKAR
ncbi:MAG: hypothetical protein WBH03_21355 [Cyclobacteriaceae bacterium]